MEYHSNRQHKISKFMQKFGLENGFDSIRIEAFGTIAFEFRTLQLFTGHYHGEWPSDCPKAFRVDRLELVTIMVNGIIPQDMAESVRYDASLNLYRENAYDAIAIYGFLIDGVDNGIISTTVTIQDGLRLVFKPTLFIA